MTRSESAPVTVAPRGSMPGDRDAEHTVVWMRGEHDIATRVSLVAAITRAAELDDADLLVDLSEVTFMDASTIGALVGSSSRLGSRSRSLQLRAPSASARRVLDLFDLADLVHTGAAGTGQAAGGAAALGTWVAVAPTSGAPIVEPARAVQHDPARSRSAVDSRLATASATVEVDRRGP